MTEVARWPTDRSIAVLRDQLAPDATDAELQFFAQVCARLELSPFADQIVLIGRWDKRVGRKVHRHQITVAGRRTLAARTGRLVGIEGPVWCGPRERGELIWREVWDEDVPPYCARVLVHVKDWQVPVNGTAKWDEFAQTDSANGQPLPLWRQMPSHMLGKVAESMALRRAFPDVIEPALEGFPAAVDSDDDAEAVAELAEAAAHNAIVDDPPPGPSSPPDLPWSPAATVGQEWQPTNADQAEAHRVLANMPVEKRIAFLSRWRIDDFGSRWPAEAVAEILAGPAGGSAAGAPAGPAGDAGG